MLILVCRRLFTPVFEEKTQALVDKRLKEPVLLFYNFMFFSPPFFLCLFLQQSNKKETPWEKHLNKLADRKSAKRAERRAKTAHSGSDNASDSDGGIAPLGGLSAAALKEKRKEKDRKERERAELELLLAEGTYFLCFLFEA